MAAKSKKITDKEIEKAFIDYVLENERKPSSIFKFSKSLGIDESVFYEYFNSFSAIEKSIWKNYVAETIEKLEAEEVYGQYTAREKLLAFYYTLIEVLKTNRSYVLYCLEQNSIKRGLNPDYLSTFKEHFLTYAETVVQAGLETEEIAKRPYISEHYHEALWLQCVFVLDFWSKDDSKGFEQTDAAIEKAVHVSFDLMGKNAFDGLIDLGKFIFQNRK